MSAHNKVASASPSELDLQIGQALVDIESAGGESAPELRRLQISGAREVEVGEGRKAIVVFVPVPLLPHFHGVQARLTRELEKKFSDRHVVFVGQRRILPKPGRRSRQTQKRPRSRTLTAVHEKILDDLVYPIEVSGKRVRHLVGGGKLLKVYLNNKDANTIDHKFESFQAVYQRLTGKQVIFEIPPQK
ncbi:hypothetical protein CANCADRAFT_137205 [Tortispora caseinolytica NRRL Y-17796]|uniref:40S ribosomal protein S7 n=1 Tax=Tortispora caseinolytica NRRL Y-17796 TaxID=767744 RepID=A0A1E4TC16_9ASCO|nr:hypothetical protein CANCADRAFT_137205 [Tortispora caseinolytica NRRL Y-17796]